MATLQYVIQDTCQVIHHIFILDPQNPYAKCRNDLIAFPIIFCLPVVDAAIHFDDQPGSVAVKICDKAADNLLPAKVESAQLIAPQGLPENLLGRCALATQFLSALELGGIDFLVGDNIFRRHNGFQEYPHPSQPPTGGGSTLSLAGKGPGVRSALFQQSLRRRLQGLILLAERETRPAQAERFVLRVIQGAGRDGGHTAFTDQPATESVVLDT